MLIFKIISFVFLMIGCSNIENSQNSEFIEKFRNENFSKYKGKSFFVRDYDNGNPIIFVYTEDCKQPLVVTIKKNSDVILKTSPHLQSGYCKSEIAKNTQLALDFSKYKINYLEVDNEQNVRVSIKKEGGIPKLAKFLHPEKQKGNWVKVVENWYELRED